MGEREMVVASHLGKTVGWGRSLKWADWVHVTNLVSRWLDSGVGATSYTLVNSTCFFFRFFFFFLEETYQDACLESLEAVCTVFW